MTWYQLSGQRVCIPLDKIRPITIRELECLTMLMEVLVRNIRDFAEEEREFDIRRCSNEMSRGTPSG